MGIVRGGRKIEVGNRFLDGVIDGTEVPTFVVDLEDQTREEARFEIEALGRLQAIAPVFRLILLADTDIFDLARPFGWPVEHFPSPEYAHQLSSSRRTRAYRELRIEITARHFANVTLIHPSAGATAAAEIARKIGRPDLTLLAPLREHDMARRIKTNASVAAGGALTGSTLTSSHGHAEVSVLRTGAGPLFISARDLWAEQPTGVPPDATVVRVDYSIESSLEFEAYVYSRIIESSRPDLAVVVPWRVAATLLPSTRYWIDLAVTPEGSDLAVIPAYRENYADLASTSLLIWDQAETYARIRRIARAF